MTGAAVRRYRPDPVITGTVREFVCDRLRRLGLASRVDEAAVLVSELVSNVILHARTEFEVRVAPVLGGVRVEIRDGSPVLPTAGTLSTTALSGRGLVLVQCMSNRWGASRGPGMGKTVWFELGPQAPAYPQVTDVEALLAMWDDRESEASAGSEEVVVTDIQVQPLLAAKAHMEDLLRELQLVLLDVRPDAVTVDPVLLELACRLNTAAQDFAEGRRQVRAQALAASARGRHVVTLRLWLPRTAAEAAQRYQQALEEAERRPNLELLAASAGAISHHADIRRRYLGAIIGQLSRV